MEALKTIDQWVCWRWSLNGRRVKPKTPKSTKVPFQPNGRKAKSTDPATWSSYEACRAAAATGEFDGVGWVFTPGTVGIDLDDVLADGVLTDEAAGLVAELASYTEVSPSGTGVKIWAYGMLDDSFQRELQQGGEKAKIEVYGHSRFFTYTGEHWNGTPTAPQAAQEAINAIAARYAPAPPEPPQKPAQRADAADQGYLREWADRVLDRAVTMVHAAGDGHKHETRVAAAKLAGGLIPHGLATAEDILALLYDANPPADNHRNETRAILAGIEYGARKELPLPDPPRQPAFRDGWALCPDHGRALRRSKNGNGWRCGERDAESASGFCSFWWKGDGYVAPKEMTKATATLSFDPVATVKPITIMHASELKSLPPAEWLMPNEILKRSIVMLYGPSNAGKSFACVDLALRCAQNHTVLYVAAEGASGYATRAAAWCEHHGVGMGACYFVPHPVNMMDVSWVDSLIAAARGLSPELIILDTLARSAIGADENSQREMGLFHEACDRVKRELDCTVLYVHHTGKNSKGYRGSSVLYGNADMVIAFNNNDGVLSMVWEKSKDVAPPEPVNLRFIAVGESLVPIPAGQVADQDDDALTPNQRKILEFLNYSIFTEHGATAAQLKEGTDIDQPAIMYRVMNRLKERGLIRQAKKREPYFITLAGQQELEGAQRRPTYVQPDGYASDTAEDYDHDQDLINQIAEKVNAQLFDDAQALAVQIMSTHRQAAVLARIQQRRVAAAEQLAVNVDEAAADRERAAEAQLDDAMAAMAKADPSNPRDVMAVNNLTAEYEDACYTGGLTTLWHRRKADHTQLEGWLALHFKDEDYDNLDD